MEARKNKLSEMTALLSEDLLVSCYKDIIQWRETSLLPPSCALRDYASSIMSELKVDAPTAISFAEKLVLEEIGRRFVNIYEDNKAKGGTL